MKTTKTLSGGRTLAKLKIYQNMDYQHFSDEELIVEYNEKQDMQALYFLIYERYREDFVDTASGVLKKYHLRANNSDVKEEINDFFSFFICGKKDGSSRLSGYDASNSFKNYILQAFRNYMSGKIEKERNRNSDKDVETLTIRSEDESTKEIDYKRIKYLSMLEALEALEDIHGDNKERDIYIWTTFMLYRTTVGDNNGVYLPLAAQLGLEVATVRQASKRVKERISKSAKHFFSQIVTFNR